jgi:ribosome maturation factor RimP
MEDSMTKREEYELKTEKLLEPIIQKNNFDLVDVEYVKEGGNWYLRAYIDKEGGISVDDCELISRALSDLLDEHDFIPDAYILEVSSPGLGRQLKKEKDFARSINKEVEIKLFKGIDKQKEFIGLLTEYDQEKLVIELENGNTLEIPRSNIALIRLAFDF